jgi:hypothetical protein
MLLTSRSLSRVKGLPLGATFILGSFYLVLVQRSRLTAVLLGAAIFDSSIEASCH